eukprot:10960726-Karenia_brevis.AAC.1
MCIRDRQSKGEWKHVAKTILHFKISRMYQSSFKRVEVSVCVDPEDPSVMEVWKLINVRMMEESGAKEMQGVAPMGELERKVQAYVDNLKK